MLNRLPRDPGTFAQVLAALHLERRHSKQIARALGVSERTVWRWFVGGAPRSAVLALWWLTPEGLSTADAEVFNLSRLHAGMSQSLEMEAAELRRQISHLGRIGNFGSANDPAAIVRTFGAIAADYATAAPEPLREPVTSAA